MTLDDFSNSFDVLLNSHSLKTPFGESASPIDITLDEYEKSIFLTEAQQDTVVNLYNGKNVFGESFESSEELRRYLDELVITKVYETPYTPEDNEHLHKVSEDSEFYKLPEDIGFITLEQVEYVDAKNKCIDGYKASVYPITQDEYARVKDNPFRGPTKYKVIRLDYGNNLVELIPNNKYKIGKYLVKYLAKPEPIILINLPENLEIEGKNTATECKLNPLLHRPILEKAVQLALASKRIGTKS